MRQKKEENRTDAITPRHSIHYMESRSRVPVAMRSPPVKAFLSRKKKHGYLVLRYKCTV